MISLDYIDSDIAELEKDASEDAKSYRILMLLRELRIYLLTEPSADTLQHSIDKLNRKLDAELLGYDYWLKYICNPAVKLENRKSKFMSDSDIPKIRKQIKNMRYLLGEINYGEL
jgi:hypothetical protein